MMAAASNSHKLNPSRDDDGLQLLCSMLEFLMVRKIRDFWVDLRAPRRHHYQAKH